MVKSGYLIILIISILYLDGDYMKKIILLLYIVFLVPLQVLAYSNNIIPGGETLGIQIDSNGIMVIGFYPINGRFNKGTPEIKSGDYIKKINDTEVNSIKELTNLVEQNVNNGYVLVTFKRNGVEKVSKLSLIQDGELYKTGLYVKDSIIGIGTLSYIDPETGIYGALGHEIVESNTNSIVEIKSGKVFRNYITGIDKSSNGVAGSKNAKFYYDTIYGSILKNTNVGIYGKYMANLPDKEVLPVANEDDIKIGNAIIYTVLDGENISEYNIEIIAINGSSSTKNLTFKITDDNLINKTGGVVQGMSGSPIIQNNRIIGAVTHVVVDNPLTGYGVFITKMLEEGEK